MRQRSIVIGAAGLVLWTGPAFAELRIPCLWNPFGGCSVTLVSPEYAKRPVKPLDKEAALVEINAFRAANGREPLVLDERLCEAAAAQSKAQAARSGIGHTGNDGSKPMERGRGQASTRRSPRRTSPQDKNLSAMRSAPGRKAPLIAPISCVPMSALSAWRWPRTQAAAPIGPWFSPANRRSCPVCT